jgi:HEAT repeat protein
MHITRRKVIVTLLLAALVAAGAAGLSLWDLKHRSGLPPLVRERMPAYWHTCFLEPADVREAVRGLYGETMEDRCRAAQTLRNLGPRAEPAIPWLLAALADGQPLTPGNNPNPLMSRDDRPAATDEPPAAPSLGEQILARLFPRPAEDTSPLPTSLEAGDTLAEIGPPALPHLVAALSDAIPEVRIEAARALGNIADPQAVEPLCAAAMDRNPFVRQAAAEALGQFDDPRAIAALAAMAAKVDGVREVRLVAIRMLARLGPAGRKVLVQMLIHGAQEQRDTAILGLGDYYSPEALEEGPPTDIFPAADPAEADALLEVLTQASRSTNEVMAIHAIMILGRHPNDRTAAVLVAALRHKSSYVQEAVWRSLGKPKAPALPPLAALLTAEDRDPRLCLQAAADIAWIGRQSDADSQAAADALAKGLKSPNAEVRRAVASALSQLKTPASTDMLAAALDDPDAGVRLAAAVSLAFRHDVRALPVLSKGILKDRDMTASAAMAKFGAAAIPAIVQLAGQEPSRMFARDALADIRDPKAVGLLMAIAADKASPLRSSACRALDEIGDKQAADLLASLLDDPDIRAPALRALARLRDERALAPLVADLDSSRDDDVRASLRGLALQQDPRAAEPIQAMLKRRGLEPGPKYDGQQGQAWDIRHDALEALAASGDVRAVDMYLYLAMDGAVAPDPLAPLGDAVFEPLVKALSDPRGNVADRAIVALFFTARSRAIPSVLEALPHMAPPDRDSVIRELGRLDEPEAREALARLATTHADWTVRTTAVFAMAWRTDPQAIEALRRVMTSDPIRLVRILAWQTLKTLVDEPRPAGLPERWLFRNAAAPLAQL